MFGMGLEGALLFPKTALVTFLTMTGLMLWAVISDARKPDPPPIVWTAQERDTITKCAEFSSAGWCAYNALRLREVLK